MLANIDSPLVSIIVRTIDRPIMLRECLKSLERQDYPNMEILIVNDGGPSIEYLVEELAFEKECRLIELQLRHGRSASANVGLEQARGKYIGFLDDDDIYYPFHVSTLVQHLESSSYKVAYSDALRAEQINCPFEPGTYISRKLSLHHSRDFDFDVLLEDNFIPILCPLFDARCISDNVRFDVDLPVLEDWDFWISIGRRFPFHHIKKITAEYRVRADGSNTTVDELRHIWDWSRERVRSKCRSYLTQKEVA